jgi:NADPH:quinone reductase-like Zn-dependent oxidoreductase
MKAAVVLEAGKPPIYGEFTDPLPEEGEVHVAVTAAALSHVTQGRASGTHYSSSGQQAFVAGIDGVGRLDDGRRVYFVLPAPPFGSMAEHVVIKSSQCVLLPDGLDDVTAAALAIPGMSSWVALRERAKLVAGETVLVNGATGTAGRLAVQIAKYLGAKTVIATGRNAETLQALEADEIIPLLQNEEMMEKAFMGPFRGRVDIVLDYLWGPSAERLLIAAARASEDIVPIRFVQIGAASAPTLSLPSAVLRSSGIELMGSGIGSVPLQRQVQAIDELMQAALPNGFAIATKTVPLSEVEAAWATGAAIPRTVFLIGNGLGI